MRGCIVKDVMTAPEVAKLLRMAVATVRRQTDAGIIPGRKVGKQYRYSRKAIEDWIRNEQLGR